MEKERNRKTSFTTALAVAGILASTETKPQSTPEDPIPKNHIQSITDDFQNNIEESLGPIEDLAFNEKFLKKEREFENKKIDPEIKEKVEIFEQTGNPSQLRKVLKEKELETLNNIIEYAEETKNEELKAEIYYQRGNHFRRIENDNIQAIQDYEKALSIENQTEEQKVILNILIGMSWRSESIFEKALTSYKEALGIAENSKEEKAQELIPLILGNQANILRDIGEYKEAIHNTKKAIEIHERNKNEERMPILINNLGALYNEIGKFEKAKEKTIEAKNIYEKMNDERGKIDCQETLGDIAKKEGNYEQALEIFTNILQEIQEKDIIDKSGRTYANLGETYFEMGIYEKAIRNIKKALEYKMSDQEKEQLYQLLRDAYFLDNQPLKSCQIREKHDEIQKKIAEEKYNAIIHRNINLEKTKTQAEKEKAEEAERNEELANERLKYAIAGALALLAGLIGSITLALKNKKQKQEIANQKELLEKAQKELQNINKYLEKRIEERTKVIQEQKEHIEEKNKELENANEDKTKLLNLFAHTFRTNVMHINAEVQEIEQLIEVLKIDKEIFENQTQEFNATKAIIMNQEESDADTYSKLQETLENIEEELLKRISENEAYTIVTEKSQILKENTNKLWELMNNISDSLDIQDGKLEIEPFPTKTNMLEFYIQSFVGGESVEIKNEWNIDTEKKSELLLCETWFIKLLKVLISNAKEYTQSPHVIDNRKPQIKIKTTETQDEIWIEVIDNGRGFTKKAQENIGKFLNTGEDLLNVFDGLGLGLFQADFIMHKHGGTIEAFNNTPEKPDDGATVRLRFPKQKKEASYTSIESH